MQFRINSFLVVLAALTVLMGTAGVAQAGLIAHWAFDESVGASTAVDSTGNGHNGAIDTTSGMKPTTGQTGKIGKSYFFTGAQDPYGDGGVTVPHASDLDTFSSATFCGWLYMERNQNLGKAIMQKYSGDYAPQSYSLAVYTNHLTIAGRTRTPGTLEVGTYKPQHLGLNAWYQFALTYTGHVYDGSTTGTSTLALYVNGQLIQTGSLTDQDGIQPTDEPVVLGTYRGPGKEVFDGWLDDLGIWGEDLSEAKIKALYNVVGVSGLEDYNLSYMETLFDVYDTGVSDTAGGLTWEKDTNLPGGHSDGDAWTDGGYYYVQLETGSAMGVKAVVPEPSTLLLLASGLIGLLAYAWRKRK